MTPLTELKRALVSRSGSGARYGLHRMRAGLSALDHPERALACVHVAGTNGKGSVCAMVEAMARAAGLSTATFTSPHLCRIEERIRLGDAPISPEEFSVALGAVLDPAVPWLTFFETITAAFFVAARRRAVDLAVVEVGLGGRLDATNVIPPPRACAVVSVGRDHTSVLGADLATIAREKAGIIKPGVPTVLGPLASEPLEAVLTAATEAASGRVSVVALDEPEAHALERRGLSVILARQRGERVALSSPPIAAVLALGGAHQRGNAAVAAGLGQELGFSLEAITAGLEGAVWPGRFERIERDGVTVLFDCAHNEDGAAALAASLATQAPERTLLLFGAMADKPWERMLDTLARLAERRLYAPPIGEVAGRAPAATERMSQRHPGSCHPTPEQALEAALSQARAGDMVVVAGSIFLVGAARAWLLGLDRDVLLPM